MVPRSLDPGEAHGAHKPRCAARRAKMRRGRKNRPASPARRRQARDDKWRVGPGYQRPDISDQEAKEVKEVKEAKEGRASPLKG